MVYVVGFGNVGLDEVSTWGNWDVHINGNVIENVTIGTVVSFLNEYDGHAVLRGNNVRINSMG